MSLYGAAQEPKDVDGLTDDSGGSTDGTLEAVSGSGADGAINNNIAELNAKLEELLDALKRS